MQLDPTDVHEADLALQQAEQAWIEQSGRSEHTRSRDHRPAQGSDRRGGGRRAQGPAGHGSGQATSFRPPCLRSSDQTQQALNKTQQTLNQTQTELQRKQAEAAEQQKKLADLEAKLKDARDTIAKIAAVKDDDRGMVITLQGEVLLRDGQMGPQARRHGKARSDRRRAARQRATDGGLRVYRQRRHTRHSTWICRRSVRTRCATTSCNKGIPRDLITAEGKGPDNPISDNNSIEGRAANRRVEIVVQPKKS